jgi:hypothetical protein
MRTRRANLEIRIGVSDSPKEISLEIEDELDALTKRIEQSLASSSSVLWFQDEKGKKVGVPSAKVAYVEIDTDTSPRAVGFRP